MAKMTDLVYSMFDAASTVASGVDKYTQKQAELSTETKNIQLQTAIRGKLAEIKQSGNPENWNNDINTFFEQIKGGMSNPESPYYCKNNLQAEMFTKILNQNQVNVSDHVNNLVIERQIEQNKVDVNNGILGLMQMGYAGQELYDKSKELINNANAVGTYTPAEYNKMDEYAFYNSYSTMYDNMFNETATEAVKRGDSWENVKTMMQQAAPILMRTDAKNMPTSFDKDAYDSKIFNDLERKFKALQQDTWNATEKTFAENWDSVRDQTTAQGRNAVKSRMRNDLDNIKGTGLMSPDQFIKWTNWLTLEDYADPEGTTSRAKAQSAMSKLDPKNKIAYYINSWKNGSLSEEGGPTSGYNTWNLLKNDMLNEARSIDPNATWEDVKKTCPTVMEFFDTAKKEMKNIPGMSDVLTNAEKMLGAIAEATKNKDVVTDFTGQAMDIVNDMLMEVDVSRLDKATVDSLIKRTAIAFNSLCGGVLEKQKGYQWLKDEEGNISVLRDYKEGVFGNEATMAKALQERAANPDLVYKDSKQIIKPTYGDDLDKGLTSLEAAEKDEIASYLKYNSNLNISKADIKGDYEEDGAYDVKANKIYTVVARDKNGQPVDEYQYKFSSSDGKHVTMQRKKKGATDWETVKTSKQQEKYDSPRETAKRAVQDIDVSTVPPFEVPATGVMPKVKYTQKEWNEMNNVQKKNIIMSLLQKYPEEMQSWLDKQPDKSKKK